MVMLTEPVRTDEVVGLTEAGKRFDPPLTAETIKRYIERGWLQGVWIAGRRFVISSDLERLLRKRKAARR